MKKYICTLFLLFTLLSLSATTLSGLINNHHGQTLELYYQPCFLVNDKVVVDSCIVGTDGTYAFEFAPEQRRTYYIDLGKLRAQVILLPGQNFEADLPNFSELTTTELLDPYFSIDDVLLYNSLIEDDNYYITDIEINTTLWLDTVINSLSPTYEARRALKYFDDYKLSLPNSFLKDYLDYSASFFFQVANLDNSSAIKQEYLRRAVVDLYNPAFISLFQNEFETPFLARDGLFYAPVSNAIVSEKISDNFIQEVKAIHKVQDDAMAELLCIKGFYNAGIMAPNYKGVCCDLLLQLSSRLKSEDMQLFCELTYNKMSRLVEGRTAPYYELYTTKGKKVPIVLKRKHVLLAFINTNLYDCRKQLAILEQYKKTYKRQLEIVCIAAYQSNDELQRFINRNDFDGIYLTNWDDNSAILDDYNVKVLPTYSLIGPDGKLVFSAMPSPEEDMYQWLQTVLGD